MEESRKGTSRAFFDKNCVDEDAIAMEVFPIQLEQEQKMKILLPDEWK